MKNKKKIHKYQLSLLRNELLEAGAYDGRYQERFITDKRKKKKVKHKNQNYDFE